MFSLIAGKDLFSWENLAYEIKPGISQITGFNFDDNTSEGSGKSSVLNILCWTLYGRIPKDAKIDEVVREGCKSGVGAVHLVGGASVHRSRKPNDLYIARDGEELRGKDAKETQAMINKLIGLDFESFCQSVYFAQNYPKKFISANETDKAAILSEIQDLTIFDKARNKVQAALKIQELELDLADREHTSVQAEIKRFQSNAELLVQFIDKFEADRTSSLKALDKEISLNRRRLKDATAVLEKAELSTVEAEIKVVNQNLSALATRKAEAATQLRGIDGKKRDLERLQRNLSHTVRSINDLKTKLSRFDGSNNCPVCGEIVADDKIGHVFKEKASLENEINSAEEEKIQLEAEVADFPPLEAPEDLKKSLKAIEREEAGVKERLSDLQSLTLSVRRAEDEVRDANRRLADLEKQVAKLNGQGAEKETAKLMKLAEDITALEEKAKEIFKARSDSVLRVNNLTILKTGFREVKQFVFQSLLNELSVKASALAADLFEVPVSIRFTNEDDEGSVSKILTDVTLDGKTRGLGLFSGGQYKRIELAVDLALASIVANRSQAPINFRILDEPFKDLSAQCAERVVKLLEKLEGATVIIEHNEFTKSIINNTFHVEYRDGVSRHAS